MPVYKKINKDFFKKWSHNTAYVLGLLAADGSIRHNRRGAWYFDLQLTDEQLVRDVKKALNSNHTITRRKRELPENNLYRLQIGSKEMCEDLAKYGIVPNKTKIFELPKIPKKYFGDFVRGYFDGDGCVYFGEHFAKDRGGFRLVFHTKFISSHKLFLEQLHETLSKYNFNGGFIGTQKFGHELVFSHHDSLALFRLMYNNKPRIFLDRKYKKLKNAIQEIYPGKLRE